MALPAVPAAGAKPRDTLKPRIPAFLGKDPGGMVFLQSFHRNHMPPLQRCCIGHKKVDIFFRIRLRMPPLRMVGIHHVASIIPPLRCLHLDSQEWFFVVKDEIVPLAVSPGFSDPKAQACRFSYKGRFKTLSNPLWHAPPCTCELNIPRLILPPRHPLTRPPSWLISPLSSALATPPTLAYSLPRMPRRTLPADECAFSLESCCFG